MNKKRSPWLTLAIKDPNNIPKMLKQSPELFEYDADVKKIEGIDKISAGGAVLFVLAYVFYIRMKEQQMVDNEGNDG